MQIQFAIIMTVATFIFSFSSISYAYDRMADQIQVIRSEIMNSNASYDDLRELTTQIGPRPSGSSAATQAVDWSIAKMKTYKFDRVFTQELKIPHWHRGSNEKAEILGTTSKTSLAVAALGRSAGTSGSVAEVIEVQSLEDVRNLGQKVQGKIIFYNRPMDPNLEDTFEAYGQAMDQRTSGPNLAARLGAVAVLVRSLTTLQDDDHPHTGATYFSGDVTPIPAAALSTHAANVLSKALKEQPDLKVRLELSAENRPDTTSYNVIGEIVGRELPDEIVLVGGHLDSWDLGQGAHDDGAGIVQSLDVCRSLVKLNMRPRRTVRCVMYMTEELGGIGGEEYAKLASQNAEKHIMAIESDRGGFAPEKFSVDGTPEDIQELNNVIGLFSASGVQSVYQGGAGTDVAPLASLGTLTMELIPNSKHYFDYHHAATDRFEAVNPEELKNGAAALAAIVFYFGER